MLITILQSQVTFEQQLKRFSILINTAKADFAQHSRQSLLFSYSRTAI